MHNYCQNQKNIFLILVVSSGFLIVFFVSARQKLEAANTSSKGSVHSEFLRGTISRNELIDNLEKLGIKCVVQESAASSRFSTLRVEKVHLGSGAYYGGILAGDTIKDLHRINADTYSLSIERADKTYQLNLHTLPAQLSDELPNQANNHMQAGGDYARNLLYGQSSASVTGTAHGELLWQKASLSTLKPFALQGEENKSFLRGEVNTPKLLSSIQRGAENIEILNPTRASFVHVNLCMAAPTDPYGKLQWDLLISERDSSSALSASWNQWERNIGDYICRRWAITDCPSTGMAIYHVVLKNNGKIGEIKLMPISQVWIFTINGNVTKCGNDMIRKLNGFPILFFPHLSRVREIHLEIGLFNK